MMQLRGDISGLLRRGSPVQRIWSGGVVALVHASGAVSVAISDREIETESPDRYSLDLTNRTGRFHAREWLLERGHDVGSEDRADVLAWSVLSVHRGGGPLKVAAPWDRDWVDHRKTFRTGPMRFFYAVVLDDCWWINDENGERVDSGQYPKSTDGRADCDAALLRLGWALTNPDGSLTLPPLPEAQ